MDSISLSARLESVPIATEDRRQRSSGRPDESAGALQAGSFRLGAIAVAAPDTTSAPTDGERRPAAAIDLTRREAEVLRLLAHRWTDKLIAAALGISPRTAMGRAAVRAKLRMRNRHTVESI